MNYLEDDIKFFSRLVSGSQSGVIASAEQVKDYNWNQGAGAFQNVINNYLKEQIDLKNETIGVGSILFFDQYITEVLPFPQQQSIGAIDGRKVIYNTGMKGFMIQYENKYYISTADNLLDNIGMETNDSLPPGIRKPFEQTIYIAKDTFIPYVLDPTTDVLKPLNVNRIENVTV